MKRVAAFLAALAIAGAAPATAHASHRWNVQQFAFNTYSPWCGAHPSPFHHKIGLVSAWWCENNKQHLEVATDSLGRPYKRCGYTVIDYAYVEDHWTHWYQRWVRSAWTDGSCNTPVGVLKWAHYWTGAKA